MKEAPEILQCLVTCVDACGTTPLVSDWLFDIADPTVRASISMPQRSPSAQWKGSTSTKGDWLVQEAGASAHP